MSTNTKPRQIGSVRAPNMDPLETLREGEVLRCRDDRTGWIWFYALEDGPVRYHEREGFDGVPTARTVVSETVSFDNVESATVSKRTLEIARGGR